MNIRKGRVLDVPALHLYHLAIAGIYCIVSDLPLVMCLIRVDLGRMTVGRGSLPSRPFSDSFRFVLLPHLSEHRTLASTSTLISTYTIRHQHHPANPTQSEAPTYTPICARLSAATRSVSPKDCLKALEAIWVYLFQLFVCTLIYGVR